MGTRLAPTACVVVALSACTAATSAYVGDVLPPDDGTPVLFAPGVISTGDVFASTFTPQNGAFGGSGMRYASQEQPVRSAAATVSTQWKIVTAADAAFR